MARHWFKRRRYGWGWTPVTWQGWAVVIGYLSVIATAATVFRNDEPWVFLLIFLCSTAGLFRISYRKGPDPRWRWGEHPSDHPDEDL